MAKLHRYTVQEAINTESSGVWTIGAATTVSNSALQTIHGSANQRVDAYHTIGITLDQPIHIRFTTTDTPAVEAAKDIQIEVGTHFIKIPHGLGSEIYLNMIRATSSDATAKIVLI